MPRRLAVNFGPVVFQDELNQARLAFTRQLEARRLDSVNALGKLVVPRFGKLWVGFAVIVSSSTTYPGRFARKRDVGHLAQRLQERSVPAAQACARAIRVICAM